MIMKWKSLALDEPPIIVNYSAPVLVRTAPREYFSARFFKYEDGFAVWEIIGEDRYAIPATVNDYWMSTDGFEEDFE